MPLDALQGGSSLDEFRITAPSTDASFSGPQPNARLNKDGTFTLSGVPAGPHLIRPAGNSRGWSLKSVTVAGRDVTDTPVELRSGETLGGIAVTFTDKVNEISGTVLNDQGAPGSEYTILAFSTDPSFWRPQSRQIASRASLRQKSEGAARRFWSAFQQSKAKALYRSGQASSLLKRSKRRPC